MIMILNLGMYLGILGRLVCTFSLLRVEQFNIVYIFRPLLIRTAAVITDLVWQSKKIAVYIPKCVTSAN